MAISEVLRFEVFRRDGFRCVYCGRRAAEQGVTLEPDHRISIAAGGTDTLENLVTSCRACNAGKGASVAPDPRLNADAVSNLAKLKLLDLKEVRSAVIGELRQWPPFLARQDIQEVFFDELRLMNGPTGTPLYRAKGRIIMMFTVPVKKGPWSITEYKNEFNEVEFTIDVRASDAKAISVEYGEVRTFQSGLDK